MTTGIMPSYANFVNNLHNIKKLFLFTGLAVFFFIPRVGASADSQYIINPDNDNTITVPVTFTSNNKTILTIGCNEDSNLLNYDQANIYNDLSQFVESVNGSYTVLGNFIPDFSAGIHTFVVSCTGTTWTVTEDGNTLFTYSPIQTNANGFRLGTTTIDGSTPTATLGQYTLS
ncbi:MAG TPA: hypothetical protein VEP90_17950, partial [Methylomirabilota bacterium]|nr:hypothetical protein [Methylomirabilota bacterium]